MAASQPELSGRGEEVLEKRDPIKATLAGLASLGRASVPVELVFGAWRDALYPELEGRVGERLSVGLSDAQLSQFEALVDADDEDTASQWLTAHVPHYPEIVAEEFDRLIGEVVDWFARQAASSIEGNR